MTLREAGDNGPPNFGSERATRRREKRATGRRTSIPLLSRTHTVIQQVLLPIEGMGRAAESTPEFPPGLQTR